MPFQTAGGFQSPDVTDEGLRQLSAGMVLTASLLQGIDRDDRSAARFCFPSGWVTGGAITASGLTVSIPAGATCLVAGTLWVATGVTTYLVPDDTTCWLWLCGDGVLRHTATFVYPTGFGDQTAMLLCRVTSASGVATVDVTVRQETIFASPRSWFLPLALRFGRRVIALPNATYTLEAWERGAVFLDFSGALTAQRTVILPLQSGQVYRVYNGTTGGHGVECRGATGAGVVIGHGKRAWIECDGVNWYRTTPDV